MLTAMCSKLEMKSIAQKVTANRRLLFPDTAWAGSRGELVEALSTLPSGHWVLKPNNLGGGLVYFLDKQEETPAVPEAFFKDVKEQSLAFHVLAPLAWRSSEGGLIIERKIGARGVILQDYKVHVFQGRPRILSVYSDRDSDLSVSHFLLPDGEEILFQRGPNPPETSGLSREELFELLECATRLALVTSYIRIDFYVVCGDIWFGEFSPFGGIEGLAERPEIDQKLGEWWGNTDAGEHRD